MKRSNGLNRNVCPPTLKPLIENAGGNERGLPPQIIPAKACSSTSRPSVTMIAFSGGAPSIGRITTRSITAPSTRPLASAMRKPTQYGAPASITVQAMNVVTISIPAWAKLRIRVARQISTSESATAA